MELKAFLLQEKYFNMFCSAQSWLFSFANVEQITEYKRNGSFLREDYRRSQKFLQKILSFVFAKFWKMTQLIVTIGNINAYSRKAYIPKLGSQLYCEFTASS